jgi:hypothetical protein
MPLVTVPPCSARAAISIVVLRVTKPAVTKVDVRVSVGVESDGLLPSKGSQEAAIVPLNCAATVGNESR